MDGLSWQRRNANRDVDRNQLFVDMEHFWDLLFHLMKPTLYMLLVTYGITGIPLRKKSTMPSPIKNQRRLTLLLIGTLPVLFKGTSGSGSQNSQKLHPNVNQFSIAIRL
jgi:hypothetical protein